MDDPRDHRGLRPMLAQTQAAPADPPETQPPAPEPSAPVAASEAATTKAAPKVVDSASDARTVNNIMRHSYRVLDNAEKAAMLRVKDLGLLFVQELHAIGGTDPLGVQLASRELAVAQTKIEEGVMWAVKHITR